MDDLDEAAVVRDRVVSFSLGNTRSGLRTTDSMTRRRYIRALQLAREKCIRCEHRCRALLFAGSLVPSAREVSDVRYETAGEYQEQPYLRRKDKDIDAHKFRHIL